MDGAGDFAEGVKRGAQQAGGELGIGQPIAGPVHPDDILGLVFSRFCIGK